MEIQKHIKELLFTYDCIVLPDFGGFLMQYVPAEIHPVTNKFLPPSKTIAFNEQLNVNDGLLVSYIVRKANKSQEEAIALIRDFVKGVKKHLTDFNLYVLEDVGRFFLNSHQQLEFEPDKSINYLEDSFGLTELFSKPIERNYSDMRKVPPRIVKPAKMKPPAKKQADLKTANKKENKTNDDKFLIDVDGEVEKKSFPFLLFIPILLMVSSVGLLFYINQSGKSLASLIPGRSHRNTEIKRVEKSTSDEEEAPASIVPASEVATESSEPSRTDIPAELNSIPSKPAVVHTSPKAKIETAKVERSVKVDKVSHAMQPKATETISYNYNIVSLKTGKYFIIVGSFAEKSNAIKLNKKIIKSGGIPVIIAPDETNKFYKVAVEDFTDINTAIAKLDTYKPKFGEGVWVMAY